MRLPKDLRDFLAALNDAQVRYMVVGGYATIFHGYFRSTQDIDVWVERTEANYRRLVQAFLRFGMPVFDMTEDVFLLDERHDVFTFGRPPACIDLMNKVKGLEFSMAFLGKVVGDVDGIAVPFICKDDLKVAKAAAGRHRDLDDLEQLG